MPANTSPIYVLTPNTDWTPTTLTTANTAMDGTGTVVTCFTAGSNGAFVNRLSIRALGTNVATVMRVFLNNGSANSDAANNILIADITLPATTASNSAQIPPIDFPLNVGIKAGHKLNLTIGTSVAAGYEAVAYGGDY